ncbi:Uncharacterised protein [Mycobacterium tuberculosis]|uniref:Uncharacterized protein n=1 Tax=Mycobacterium tuberculosis TaxID=1773 RepID=A0A655AGE2_MYCTX|nr:Uncharacterised protein [Mycobacterium tuberculosis]
MGVSGHVLLCADITIRHTRRLPGAGRRPAPGRHRRHRGLGPSALPEGRVGPGTVRRHSALRTFRSQTRRATGLGHIRVRLRPPGSAQLSGSQCVVLATGVPHRRPAGGRGGLNALSRLLATRGRLDPQRPRRPGEPGSSAVPAGDERHGAQGRAGNRHHRRGVHAVAWGDPPDQHWRPGLFDEVEHGLDARHARLRQPRSGVPQLPPPRDDVLDAVCVQRKLRVAAQS